MKKNYIAPNLVERRIVLHQMIAGSANVNVQGLDGFGGYGGDGTGKTPGARSKGWDDDDDF